jgi:hypothetical protein
MPSVRGHILVMLGLALVMAATRFPGLASSVHLRDASWALFFIAGFYLTQSWRWAFPALMAWAVAIDFVAIKFYGISNYCVTVAYWFLVPAYGALWLGGRWLRQHASNDARGLMGLVASAVASTSICFLLTNGSFYWLGGRVAEPTWQGWVANFTEWYWSFVSVSLAYITVAALGHYLVTKVLLPRRTAAYS